MVLDFYNLKEQPFGVTPDPRYLYLGLTHREALASMVYSIQSGRGFMGLIAAPGMGKTTLLRYLLQRFEGSARIAFLCQTLCRREDIMRGVLRDLGLVADGTDIVRMEEELNDVLLAEARGGRKVIVVIDEAQNLDDAALELVRLLSNFETSSDKLMQIVIAGQPQLGEKLISPQLLQLRQRMSTIARLPQFNREETSLYIAHRLSVAGYDLTVPLFTPEAEALIAKSSGGIPRNVNNICFNALSLGFVLKQRCIEKGVVREVLDDLDLSGTESHTQHDGSIGHKLFAYAAAVPGTLANAAFGWRRRLAVFIALLLPLIWFSGPGHNARAVRAVPPSPLPAVILTQTQAPPSSPANSQNALVSGAKANVQPDTESAPIIPHGQPGKHVPRRLQDLPSHSEANDLSMLWQQVKRNRTDAEVKLARIYLEGTVVPQDCIQAQILLRAASRKSNQLAAELLKDSTERCP